MIYHDILGVNVLADSAKIESAYQKRVVQLNESNLKIKAPLIYNHKIKELETAKKECLNYMRKPFSQKTKIELSECVNRAVSPNTTNSCCCGEGCGTCCTCACIGILIAIGYSIFEAINNTIQSAKRQREIQRQNEERRQNELEQERLREKQNQKYQELCVRKQEDNLKFADLSYRMPDVEASYKTAESELKKINSQFLDIEKNITIVNDFFIVNGVNVNLKEASPYIELVDKRKNIIMVEERFRREYVEIKMAIETIERRNRELENFEQKYGYRNYH